MVEKENLVDDVLSAGAFGRIATKYTSKKSKTVEESTVQEEPVVEETPAPEPEEKIEPKKDEKKKPVQKPVSVNEVYRKGAFKNTASKYVGSSAFKDSATEFVDKKILKIIKDSVSTKPSPRKEVDVKTLHDIELQPVEPENKEEPISVENNETAQSINKYVIDLIENSSKQHLAKNVFPNLNAINSSNVDRYIDKSAHNAIIEAAHDVAADPNQSVEQKLKVLESKMMSLAQSYSGGGENPAATRQIQTQINTINRDGTSGIEFTGGFAGKSTEPGTQPWDAGTGISITQADVDVGRYKTFSFDRDVHLVTDSPYWSSPTPLDHTDKGVFGGAYNPPGVDTLFDFTNVDPDTYEDGTNIVTTGRIRLNDLTAGDTIRARFDFNVIPQIANTTIEPALWYKNRDADDNVTFTFNLPAQPVFYGTGTVGNTYLNRVEISAYIASTEDINALTYPAIKSDNPILIQPLSMLVTVIR